MLEAAPGPQRHRPSVARQVGAAGVPLPLGGTESGWRKSADSVRSRSFFSALPSFLVGAFPFRSRSSGRARLDVLRLGLYCPVASPPPRRRPSFVARAAAFCASKSRSRPDVGFPMAEGEHPAADKRRDGRGAAGPQRLNVVQGPAFGRRLVRPRSSTCHCGSSSICPCIRRSFCACRVVPQALQVSGFPIQRQLGGTSARGERRLGGGQRSSVRPKRR